MSGGVVGGVAGCSMCVCDPADRSTLVLDLVLGHWTSAGHMGEYRTHFHLLGVQDRVFAVGSGQEGRVEMFDENTEEWETLEQVLPTDIRLPPLVVNKDFVRQ